MSNKSILLATLNARYIHASLGLRYLYANMDELQPQTELVEFTIKTPAIQIADEILEHNPRIVGFGIYIWNVKQTTELIKKLKQIRPEIIVVIGGPEVSYEYEHQTIVELADYLITGQADLAFKSLCRGILNNQAKPEKIIRAQPFSLSDLKLPYEFYNREDLAHRVIYVEASRGCPFKCEFCLSSLDKTAYPFDLDLFLADMVRLYDRGARTFKFVDRTFNLKIATSINILEFFLERATDDLFLHFELIPDNLPDALKNLLVEFPAGSLQFEIGVQTFTEEVQSLISRRQHNEKTKDNIRWLKQNTHAHLHTDLIFGLPGETLESFITSFNQLVELGPDEIQLGILKRLRGTPIIRHTETHNMKFNDQAPYEIISTNHIDALTTKKITHFARFWDKIANSGRFRTSIPLILTGDPFRNFMALSEYLYDRFKRSHTIQLEDLFAAVEDFYSNDSNILATLNIDKQRSKIKTRLTPKTKANRRQIQHLAV